MSSNGLLLGLLTSLQELEWPAEVQCSYLNPSGLGNADDLALDFDNFHKAAIGNLSLLDSQRAAIDAIDDLLGEMSRGGRRFDESLWTDEGLRSRSEWARLRELARAALRSFGKEPIPAPTGPLWKQRSEGVIERWRWPNG